MIQRIPVETPRTYGCVYCIAVYIISGGPPEGPPAPLNTFRFARSKVTNGDPPQERMGVDGGGDRSFQYPPMPALTPELFSSKGN